MKRRFQIRWGAWTFVVLFFFMVANAFAQSDMKPSSSNIEILKLKWEKQTRLPNNFDPSVIPTGAVFSNMESRTVMPGSTEAPIGDAARKEAEQRSAALAPVDYFPKTPGRMPVFYLYSLKIRNAGSKKIQAVAWDCIFLDATGKTVLGAHQLLSYSIVKPAQSVTLQAPQRTRLMNTVQAGNGADAGNNGRRFLARAAIQCVLYDDETTWRNPAGRDAVCDLLKKNKPHVTHKSDAKRAKDK